MIYQKGKCLYEGKASKLYEAADEHGAILDNLLVIERKDDITKLDGEVRDTIEGKGAYTNRISNLLFRLLEHELIPTHFMQELSAHETLIVKTEPLKLEIIVRNIATGSLCKRLPFQDGTVLRAPIVELDYKDDAYHDPLINRDHALELGLVQNVGELDGIEEMAEDVNRVLQEFFRKAGITLVDFKIEIGRDQSGQLIVIDEISPDTCRLWDTETGQKLDKDIFRSGQGNDATSAAYREVFDRLETELADEEW